MAQFQEEIFFDSLISSALTVLMVLIAFIGLCEDSCRHVMVKVTAVIMSCFLRMFWFSF